MIRTQTLAIIILATSNALQGPRKCHRPDDPLTDDRQTDYTTDTAFTNTISLPKCLQACAEKRDPQVPGPLTQAPVEAANALGSVSSMSEVPIHLMQEQLRKRSGVFDKPADALRDRTPERPELHILGSSMRKRDPGRGRASGQSPRLSAPPSASGHGSSRSGPGSAFFAIAPTRLAAGLSVRPDRAPPCHRGSTRPRRAEDIRASVQT